MITRKTASYVLLQASQILPAEHSPRSLSTRLASCHFEAVLRAKRLGVVGAQDALAVGQGALVQLDGLAKPTRRLGESGQIRVDEGELMSADGNLLPAAGLDGGRAPSTSPRLAASQPGQGRPGHEAWSRRFENLPGIDHGGGRGEQIGKPVKVSCAVGLPNVGEFGDPQLLMELGVAAEQGGWDGVFVWDHVLYHDPGWPVANPTVALAAIAARTSRVRLGVLMTALPRRRVQVVGRETASLDRLSDGRLIFGAGVGSMDAEYTAFGEAAALRARAEKLDESLQVLDALWSGGPVRFAGRHVQVDGIRMLPTPVQRPRIPIWCAGRWPAAAGFRRAARWDGVMPTHADYGKGTTMPPDALATIVATISDQRGGLSGFDVAVEGRTTPTVAAGVVAAYAEAGLTWWVEAMGWWRGGISEARSRIAAGPPPR